MVLQNVANQHGSRTVQDSHLIPYYRMKTYAPSLFSVYNKILALSRFSINLFYI